MNITHLGILCARISHWLLLFVKVQVRMVRMYIALGQVKMLASNYTMATEISYHDKSGIKLGSDSDLDHILLGVSRRQIVNVKVS